MKKLLLTTKISFSIYSSKVSSYCTEVLFASFLSGETFGYTVELQTVDGYMI